MEMELFAQKVRKGVQKMLKEEAETTVQKVCKNNGVVLYGLTILKAGQNASPTIYLEIFLEMYEEGVPFSTIIDKILKTYEKGMPKSKIDMDFFRDYDKIKDKIAFKLINARKNAGLLEQIPHIIFLDLAICFYYAFYHPDMGEGTILIYNSHLDLWDKDTNDMLKLAKVNTPRIFKAELKSMESVIEELLLDTDIDSGWEPKERIISPLVPMQILSNKKRTFGAACILYPNLLKKISNSFSKNFYVLPSSVHEVILLADSGLENPRKLQEMVQDINETQVEPEEILSDHIYYYDQRSENLKRLF